MKHEHPAQTEEKPHVTTHEQVTVNKTRLVNSVSAALAKVLQCMFSQGLTINISGWFLPLLSEYTVCVTT